MLAIAVAVISKILTFDVTLTPSPSVVGSSPTVAVLQAQVEQQRLYQEQLLQIVLWSIGGVIAVGIVLAGYSWYQNQTVYERDKQTLQKSFEASVDTARNGIEAQHAQALVIERADTADRIKSSETALENRLMDEIKKVSDTRDERFDFLHASILDLRGEMFETSESWALAVLAYAQSLAMYQSRAAIRSPWVTGSILLKLQRALNRCDRETDASTITSNIDRIEATLDAAGDAMPSTTAQIRERLRELTKSVEDGPTVG